MRRQRRRFFVLGLVAIAAAMAMMWRTPSASYAGTTDTASAASAFTSSGSSDWKDAIPAVYLSGYPVQWTSVNVNGIAWTPTVIRILRGQTHFAFFSTPDGKLWAGSEDDGTLWRVHDYYDNTSWTLAQGDYDPDASAAALVELIKLILKIAAVAGLLVIVALFMLFLASYKGPKGGGGTNMNQVDLGMYAGNTSGFKWHYDHDPNFRQGVFGTEGLFDAGVNLGLWTTQP